MNWYHSLTTPEKVYFYIAMIGTVLLVIQIVMMLFSFGGGADADSDTDFGGDGISIPPTAISAFPCLP